MGEIHLQLFHIAGLRIIELLVGDSNLRILRHTLFYHKCKLCNGPIIEDAAPLGVAKGQGTVPSYICIVVACYLDVPQLQGSCIILHSHQAVVGPAIAALFILGRDLHRDGLLVCANVGLRLRRQFVFSHRLPLHAGGRIRQILSRDRLCLHLPGVRQGADSRPGISSGSFIALDFIQSRGPNIVSKVAKQCGVAVAYRMIHGNAVEIVGLAGKGGQIQIPILADHHGREHIVAAVVAQELLIQIAFIAAQKRGKFSLLLIDAPVPEMAGIIQEDKVLCVKGLALKFHRFRT